MTWRRFAVLAGGLSADSALASCLSTHQGGAAAPRKREPKVDTPEQAEALLFAMVRARPKPKPKSEGVS